MSVEIRELDRDELDRWDRLVDRSPDAGAFHQSAALDVQARRSGTDPHRLVGFKGEEPVGLFPLFEGRKGPIATAYSPPPPLWVPRLGPALLNMEKLKPGKAQRRHHRFVEGCLEHAQSEWGPRFLQVRTVGNYDDVRPFKWNGATTTPEYTYAVDLTPDEAAIKTAFSSNARRSIRGADPEQYVIERGDVEGVRRIVEQVRARYEEQGEGFAMPTAFATDLFETLPDGQVRAYVCRTDGSYASGLLTVETDDRATWWHGGVKPDGDVSVPVNDLLNWHAMRSAKRRGVDTYDLGGGGARRLVQYKTKFGPELETFYSVERASVSVKTMATAYRRVRPMVSTVLSASSLLP